VFWRLPIGIRFRAWDAHQLARRYFKRFGKPDLIHAHSTLWAGTAAARIGAAHDIPFVITEHYSGLLNPNFPTWRLRLAHRQLRASESVAAVSNALRKALITQNLTSKEKIRVIHNVVDTDFFFRPSKPRPQDHFYFLVLTNFYPLKKIDKLIRAFARAFKKHGDVQLVIGGDGPQRESIERLVGRLGLHPSVRFLGQLNRTQVREALWKANALVLSSSRETFGVVLIEAMATGLPVVATASGGPEDIVTPAVGRLVPPNDVEALAHNMRKMYQTASNYNPKAIRDEAIRRFGTDIFVRRTRTFYQEALERREKKQG